MSGWRSAPARDRRETFRAAGTSAGGPGRVVGNAPRTAPVSATGNRLLDVKRSQG